jgi:hypothetical protein
MKRMEVNHSQSEPRRLRSDAGKDSAIATEGEEMVVDVDVDSIGIDIGIGLGNGDRKMVDEDADAMDRELPLLVTSMTHGRQQEVHITNM